MNIIDKVLGRPEFAEAPPVLVDIGASYGLNSAWKDIAPYSICVAFDADDREMEAVRKSTKTYKQLHVYNRAVTSGREGSTEFYLTQSPACSSLLPPDKEALSAWEFADRFAVAKVARLPTINLRDALQNVSIHRVDWFKTDSQGTDLRLFQALGDNLINRVLVAEFEPGIIDAYRGEDKLWQVMSYMDDGPFWMSDITIRGSQRIRKPLVEEFSQVERDFMVHLLKASPGWGEVVYLNTFQNDDFSQRDYLLGWVCAFIQRQHGFAYELSVMGHKRYPDPIFNELRQCSMTSLRRAYLSVPPYLSIVHRLFRRWRRSRTGRR